MNGPLEQLALNRPALRCAHGELVVKPKVVVLIRKPVRFVCWDGDHKLIEFR
jgi:hypothetical protein